MLGNHCRFISLNQRPETTEMISIERVRSTDRHADAVQRNRIFLSYPFEHPVRGATGSHIVFGMHLKESLWFCRVDDHLEVLVLEAGAGQPRRRENRKAEAGLLPRTP